MAAVSAVAAVGALAYGIYSGEQGAKKQRQGLQNQRKQQAVAQGDARRVQRETEQARNRQNQRQPDIASILAGAQASGGLGGTAGAASPFGNLPLGGNKSLLGI